MFDMGSERADKNVIVDTSGAREPWQLAYDAMHDLGITSGLRVTTAWLYETMKIPRIPPRERGESDARFAKRAQMWSLREFQPQVDRLKEIMIERHGMWLHPAGGGVAGGAEWEIRNADGAPVLVKKVVRDIKKQLSSASSTLSQMSDDGLTDAQRAAHSDSIAKLAHIRSLMKKPNR